MESKNGYGSADLMFVPKLRMVPNPHRMWRMFVVECFAKANRMVPNPYRIWWVFVVEVLPKLIVGCQTLIECGGCLSVGFTWSDNVFANNCKPRVFESFYTGRHWINVWMLSFYFFFFSSFLVLLLLFLLFLLVLHILLFLLLNTVFEQYFTVYFHVLAGRKKPKIRL